MHQFVAQLKRTHSNKEAPSVDEFAALGTAAISGGHATPLLTPETVVTVDEEPDEERPPKIQRLGPKWITRSARSIVRVLTNSGGMSSPTPLSVTQLC